jgi:hypothetical protein
MLVESTETRFTSSRRRYSGSKPRFLLAADISSAAVSVSVVFRSVELFVPLRARAAAISS